MADAADREFWRGRPVFLTGHSGFKGGWLTSWLISMKARVTGYSLPPDSEPSFFARCGLQDRMRSIMADIRDHTALTQALANCRPEVVFHLAAQPLVLRSYREPVATFATNVMGTVNLLEALRSVSSVRAVIVVTSDKCYVEREAPRAHREDDRLGGCDPYSASKACAEIVAEAYRRSYFQKSNVNFGLATVRAGNVIGGGDWAQDRLLPDAIRALRDGTALMVRNPESVRPWQHVLEPLAGYLTLAERLFQDGSRFSGAYNFGPSGAEAASTGEVADLVVRSWGGGRWRPARSDERREAHHEAPYLQLDSGKAREVLSWWPRLRLHKAIELSIDWYRRSLEADADMFAFTGRQISSYENSPRFHG